MRSNLGKHFHFSVFRKTNELRQIQVAREAKYAEFLGYLGALGELNQDTERRIWECLDFLEVIAPDLMKMIVSLAKNRI